MTRTEMTAALAAMKIGQRMNLINTRPNGDDDEEMLIERRSGSFYGACGKYDFEAASATEAEGKLRRWGFTETQF
jgi:hypothetical protein